MGATHFGEETHNAGLSASTRTTMVPEGEWVVEAVGGVSASQYSEPEIAEIRRFAFLQLGDPNLQYVFTARP